MLKYTGEFSWPEIITNANVDTSNYTTVYDYQLEVWVTTLSHDLVRKTTIIYPFHFQVVRTAQLTIIYPVHPEPTLEPTFEPTIEPTLEPTMEPTFEPSRERNFFYFSVIGFLDMGLCLFSSCRKHDVLRLRRNKQIF